MHITNTVINKHLQYDPATWPRAVCGFASVLVLLAMCFAVRSVWAVPLDENLGHMSENMHFTHNNTSLPAVALATAIDIDVQGLHALVTVHQTFKNPSNLWVEGVYSFPLPEHAAIHAMRMTIGERTIEGKIEERKKAKQIYTAAKKAGKKAALTEQERPNLFTQSVANIGPQEEVTVTLHYLHTVTYDSGAFSLRVPTTLTPRYIPNTTARNIPEMVMNGEVIASEASLTLNSFGWATPTHAVPDAHRITPAQTHNGNAFNLKAQLNAGLPLESIHSTTHSIAINDVVPETPLITLLNQPLDRDIELVWQPTPSSTPQAAAFQTRWQDEFYTQVVFIPPTQEGSNTLHRELILVIDTSGSMAGTSITQAKSSVMHALERLTPSDTFNVLAFNASHHALFSKSQTASHHNIENAKHFVQALNAGGGTEMAGALQSALSAQSQDERLKQVVFITDGAVGNETALFGIIARQLGNARLFTVGIGSAPNSHFMRKASEFGRGSFTHINTLNDVTTRMSTLLTKLESPALSNIQANWPTSGAEVYPARIPDVYLGEPLLLLAKSSSAMDGELIFTGATATHPWARYITLNKPVAQSTPIMPALAKLWGRAKLNHLLDHINTRGLPAKATPTTPDDALEVALEYQLLSPYTSFVAVEQTPKRDLPPDASLPIPNAIPAGSTMKKVGFAKTATGIHTHVILGLLSLILATAAKVLLRQLLFHKRRGNPKHPLARAEA